MAFALHLFSLAACWPGDWTYISLHRRLVPSTSFLTVAATLIPSVVMERGVVVVGGGGGRSDRDALLKVFCTAPVKTPNKIKTNGLLWKRLAFSGSAFRFFFLLFPVGLWAFMWVCGELIRFRTTYYWSVALHYRCTFIQRFYKECVTVWSTLASG